MIYFVKLPTGSIKIGRTQKANDRFRNLKKLYGGIEILKTIPGDALEEEALHARFAHLRIRRTEQFHPGADLLEFLGIDGSIEVHATECPLAVPMVAVPVVLPASDWAALKKQAHATGRSASAIVRDLVSAHLRGERARGKRGKDRAACGPNPAA